MKKTASTVIAAMTAIGIPALSAAQSNVTIYGIVDVTTRHATNATPAWKNIVADGAFTGSRLGFKGTEDLGDGAKALFSLEGGFDPSTGTSLQSTAAPGDYGQAATPAGRFFGREALVGLSHPVYGTVTLGRQYTLAHQMSGRFQPLANPNLDPIVVFSVHHIARQDNMVKYMNQIGPVGFGASVTASEGNGKAWAASGSYTAGPFDFVAYIERMHNAANTETRNIYGAGGSYAVTDSLKGFAGYMLRTQAVSARQNRVATVGANYSLGTWVFTPIYMRDSQNAFATTAEGKRSVVSLTADYFFSKRTDVYLEIDQNRVDGGYTLPVFMAKAGTASGAMVGVRHRF
jgi:predicted porin